MKKILEFLKEKANLIVSLVTLAAALANTIIKYFAPGKLSGTMDSVVLALIAFQLLGLLVWRLDAIQGALKRMEDQGPKGVQLKKRDLNLTSLMIAEAKEELFFSSTTLTRLIDSRSALLALADKVRVRLLVMNVEDTAVVDVRETIYDRRPVNMSMSYLDCFSSKPYNALPTPRTLLC